MYSLMKLFLSFSLFVGGINIGVKCSDPKLFVFGDSYADTGNMRQNAVSWKSPYGMTFPGKPSGRYSDGLISTDFLAKVLGAKSPYLYRTHGKEKRLNRGMNLAFGGSKVYDSAADRSLNMSTQVNLLIDLFAARHVYTFDDLSSSDVAVLAYSGKDYLEYIAEHGLHVYQAFVPFIVEDIKNCLKKLDGLRFKNIGVTSLVPIGCLPHFTFRSSFKSCNETYRELVELHNKLLKVAVGKLNIEARIKKKGQRFFIIDFHKAFMTVLKKKRSTRSRNLLKPCCEGDCAHVDSKGAKKYSLCDDPKSAFFWDKVNPTQEGWKSIYSVLGNPLTKG